MRPDDVAIYTLEELTNWLKNQGVDIALWGSGDAKTLESLWAEIERGETRLQSDPPRRLTRVVSVKICRDGMMLIEFEQELEDGRIRRRDLPPSEKMKSGEDVSAATLRCLQEEMNISPERVSIIAAVQAHTNEFSSPSYPGLLTLYTVYDVPVQVVDLPEVDFWTEENHSGDPVRRHHWGWVPIVDS